MKFTGTIFIMMIFWQFANCQEESSSVSTKVEPITGVWQVDLRPTKDSEPYFKEFEVNILEGTSFSGTFYDTKFDNGLINTNWDRVHFAFTTRDANNQYFHSGYLLDGKMYGQTYCSERGFTMPWTGTRSIKE